VGLYRTFVCKVYINRPWFNTN